MVVAEVEEVRSFFPRLDDNWENLRGVQLDGGVEVDLAEKAAQGVGRTRVGRELLLERVDLQR